MKKQNLKSKVGISPLDGQALRNKIKVDLEKLAEQFRKIPIVRSVHINDCEEFNDLMDIEVYSNLMSFFREEEDQDYPYFAITMSHDVRLCAVYEGNNTDFIFDNFFAEFIPGEKKYPNVTEFYNALLKLGKIYASSVPKINTR